MLAVVTAGAAVVMGAEALAAAAGVVAVAPNCNVLCVAGLGTAAELALVVDGADQFPKRDLTAGCGAM